MRKYTTPTLNMTLLNKDGTPYVDFEFDYLIVTMKNNDYVINRTIQFADIEEANFDVSLTQEETSKLKTDSMMEIELNIFVDDKRIATDIKNVKIQKNLLDEIVLIG